MEGFVIKVTNEIHVEHIKLLLSTVEDLWQLY